MSTDDSALRRLITHDLVESLIRVGLIAVLVVLCIRAFAPFANLIAWALILAISLAPVHKSLVARVGGGEGRAATVMVLVGVLLLGVPTVALGISLADHLGDLQALLSGGVKIKPPAPGVAEWPVIGKQVYAVWADAADNLPEFLRDHRETVISLSKTLLGTAGTAALDVLLFIAAIIVTGVMLAYTQESDRTFDRIFVRLSDPVRGPRLQKLSIATVRSVAVGVIGVAFIQALILGVGFLLAKIPAAGVLAWIVFFIGILQLPAVIVTIPAIIWLWSSDFSATHNTIFTIYLIVGGFSDGVLKPMLLGRGVDAPMLVILVGALGGMMAGGLLGLFTGGVVLALGYNIFMEWVDSASPPAAADSDHQALPDTKTAG